MPAPSEGRLWQHVGDMSPMGMLWTFIGSSTPYEVFCGSIEVFAAVLLLFQRTFLLGTLVAFISLLQIFVLNMCYDVPVKIFSFFLIECSLYLVAPSFNRLYNFFLTNKTTAPYTFYDISSKKWFQKFKLGFKILILGAIIYSFYQQFGGKEILEPSKKLAFEGSYVFDNSPQKIGTEKYTGCVF